MSETDNKYIDRLIDLVKEVTESNGAQTQSIEALETKVTEEISNAEGNVLEAVGSLSDRITALEEKNSCIFASEDFKPVKENAKKLLTEETYDILTLVKNTKKFVSFVSILFIILSSVLVLVGIYALLHGFFKGA
jgi:hypothetical protein